MGIPLVGTSDCHRIWQLGTTYTLVDADEKTVPGVFAAIRAGRVRVVTAPLEPLVRIREKWDGVASAAIPGDATTRHGSAGVKQRKTANREACPAGGLSSGGRFLLRHGSPIQSIR